MATESDEELIARLSLSRAALLSLTSWHETPPKTLWTIAKLGTDEMRTYVASAPSLPTDLEEHLAAKGDEQTKIALAYRYGLSDKSIALLRAGASEELFQRLVARRDAPAWLAEEAANLGDPELRRLAVRSERLKVETVDRLANDADLDVRSAAQALRARGWVFDEGEERTDEASRTLAAHPLLTAEAAASLSSHRSREIRARLAENQRTPATVLLGLANDVDVLVRLMVLSNPALPALAMDVLIRDRSIAVRQTLARRTDLGVERLIRLARDEDAGVRETVAMRPELAPEVVLALQALGDSAVDERLAERALDAANHPSLGALWDLMDVSLEIASDRVARRILVRGLKVHFMEGRARDEVLDSLIESVDAAYEHALDEILHHPRFQELEARWRGLYAIVRSGYIHKPARTELREPGAITCEFVNCSKEDLAADFEDAPDLPKSGLSKLVYSAEYGPFGGRPYGLLHVDFPFFGSLMDVRLLKQVAGVAWRASLLVAAPASPGLLGADSLDALAAGGPKRPGGAAGTAFDEFQRSTSARHVVLFVQSLVGRDPHNARRSDGGPAYAEHVASSADVLWFPGSLALVQAAARSFHYWRVSSYVTGSEDATFEGGGKLHAAAHRPDMVLSCELVDHEGDVAGAGFASLRLDADNHPYVSIATTCHTGDSGFPELSDDDRVRNREAAGVLWITRWMQLVKVLQREQIGTWRERSLLEEELTLVLEQHRRVAPSGQGSALLSARAPLRSVSLRVGAQPGNEGWYGVELALQPNWRIDGRFPTYRLRNQLDRE